MKLVYSNLALKLGAAAGLLLTGCKPPPPPPPQLVGCWQSINRPGGPLNLALSSKNGEEGLYSFSSNSFTRPWGTFMIIEESHYRVIARDDDRDPKNLENGDFFFIKSKDDHPDILRLYTLLENRVTVQVNYARISPDPRNCPH